MNTTDWKAIKDNVYGEKGTPRRDELERDLEGFKISMYVQFGYTSLVIVIYNQDS